MLPRYRTTSRPVRLLGSLRRALRVVDRLPLPQFQNAVQHGNRHARNEYPDKPPLYSIGALAIGDVAGDDQGKNADVDNPIHRLRDNKVQGAEPSNLVEHEW